MNQSEIKKNTTPTHSVTNIFIACAEEDKTYLEELESHLNSPNINLWYEEKVNAGSVKDTAIYDQIAKASIVILLTSADFLADETIYTKQLPQLMEQHQQGRILLIPVILREWNWENSILGGFQVLPKNGQAIIQTNQQAERDQAFTDLAQLIQQVIRKNEKGKNKSQSYLNPKVNPNKTTFDLNFQTPKGCLINIAIAFILTASLWGIFGLLSNGGEEVVILPKAAPITKPSPYPADTAPNTPFTDFIEWQGNTLKGGTKVWFNIEDKQYMNVSKSDGSVLFYVPKNYVGKPNMIFFQSKTTQDTSIQKVKLKLGEDTLNLK